jgi:hypothetical protein
MPFDLQAEEKGEVPHQLPVSQIHDTPPVPPESPTSEDSVHSIESQVVGDPLVAESQTTVNPLADRRSPSLESIDLDSSLPGGAEIRDVVAVGKGKEAMI